uniref:Golgi apparatus membrane protein TVP23 homolog n=1 Tax=Cacopsylla melanoneura TaxID=428564 RepID=A0A8D8ZLH0_9HEMI
MNNYVVDDDTTPFGEEEFNRPGTLVHPYVTFFHLFFRSLAIVSYMFTGLFSSSGFIASFVFIVLLLSMDFWTVKNISGRLMVGLRWWNYVDDNGKSHWQFESRKNRVNGTEAKIFWTSLIVCQVMWCLFLLTSLFGFNFKWMLLVGIALTLNFANLYGYLRCKMGGNADNKSLLSSVSSMSSGLFFSQVASTLSSLATKNAMPPQPATNVPSPSNVV